MLPLFLPKTDQFFRRQIAKLSQNKECHTSLSSKLNSQSISIQTQKR